MAGPEVTGQPAKPAAARIVRGLAALLEAPTAARLGALARQKEEWPAVQRLITVHGLAAHLNGAAGGEALASLPDHVAAWLADQGELNARRIDRLHADLGSILSAADDRGLPVIPLKGALLTTMSDADRYRRPMGDLDLLVRPADRAPMADLLLGLGYTREPEPNPRPTHDVYVDAGGGRVVSADEHPDNPRRVEVHTELLRHLWGWWDEDQLTPAMWAAAHPGEVLGRPAMLPAPEHLVSHLAMHASADLLNGRGRLIHWLDIGLLASRGGPVSGEPHPRLAYPALALAARAMPGLLADAGIDRIEGVPGRLARWARTVPLDQRSGLLAGPAREVPHSLRARVSRWAPSSMRLAVAYGDTSRPAALALHGRLVASRFGGRLRYRAAHPDGG